MATSPEPAPERSERDIELVSNATPADIAPTEVPSQPQKSGLEISVREHLCVVAILSVQFAFLYPAVLSARSTRNQLRNDWEFWAAEHLGWFWGVPFVIVGCAALSAKVLSRILPHRIRRHFVWAVPPRPKPEPIESPRPSVFSVSAAVLGLVLLITTGIHLRADRRARRPIITWEGPLVDFLPYITGLGYLLTFVAIGVGLYALERYRHRLNWLAPVGVGFGFLNLFGSCFFWMLATED